MSNEPKLSERLRVIQNLVGGAFKIAHDGIDEESVESAWDARKADGILITCIAQCEALEAREPNVMPTYLSRDYEALYDLLLAGGEAFGLVDYKWDDNSNPSRDVVRIRRREAWRIDVGARGIGYNDFGPYLKEKWANNELNAFANDCRRMNLEWVAPLDRSRMEYTATECSEIARKRYADEPRKTSQQKEYAQGLEDGYGHALFEHAAKADRSRMVEAGDKMCALLCLFYKESATTLPEALRKDLVELVNAWESAKK